MEVEVSEDKKKQGGKLPGLGKLPSNAPLPGLGQKQGGAAGPLPGLGNVGSRPPLPGLGKGGPLPGLAGGKGIIPPFMQQQQPSQPPGPSPEEVARDPFNQPPPQSRTAPPRASYPGAGLIGPSEDPSIQYSAADAGGSRKPLLIVAGVILLVGIFVGFYSGLGKNSRVSLNIAIRDALIVKYEIEKASQIFNDVQSVVNMALAKANKRAFETTHIDFLSSKVQGSPIKPTLFTERNYKTFDPSAVQWLMEYARTWEKLDKLIQAHRMKTQNDMDALTASKSDFEKLLTTNYGVVFGRDKSNFVADLVVIGSGSKGGKVRVQADTGTYADDRVLYNPEPGDADLTNSPDKYVVPLGPNSKRGLLQKATQSHFMDYQNRLKEIAGTMAAAADVQTNLLQKLTEIGSQDPVWGGGIDVEEDVEEYKQKSGQAAAAQAAAE